MPSIEKLHTLLQTFNREPNHFGIEARIPFGDGNPSAWEALVRDWEKAGASHISLNTMGFEFMKPGDHIAAIQTFMKAIDGNPIQPMKKEKP